MAGEAVRSRVAGRDLTMQAFLVSTGVIALAEIGDKTQILSLILGAHYRKPLPIILGMFTATLANHAVAGGIGSWLGQVLDPSLLNWFIVASFILLAGWILLPDKLDQEQVNLPKHALGVFGTTVFAFFLAEMGDKTQVVTVALAARFHDFVGVVSGTTLGMMLADVPVVYLGHRFADRIPAKAVHVLAAVIFMILGGLALRNALAGAC